MEETICGNDPGGLRLPPVAGCHEDRETGCACAKGIPIVRMRTGFRLCTDSDGGLVNAMIQGSVLSMCRSTDEVLGVLGALRQSMG